MRFHGLYAFQVTAVSNLNPSYFEFSRVELGLGFDNMNDS